MELDNYHQDEPFVNIISTSPPSNTTNDDNNNASRTLPRLAGGALRSRRNPPPIIVLSTSPTASNNSSDGMHLLASQQSVPPLPVETAAQDTGSSMPSTSVALPIPASSAMACGKSKAHSVKDIKDKELEIQQHSSSKPQDCGERQAVDATDFECSLCIRVFYQPVTTTCGHVFCKQCLFSSLKYSIQCPLCRHKLDTNPVQHKYAVNVVLMNMIEKYFPKEHQERLEEDMQYQEAQASKEKQLQPQGVEEESPLPSSPSWSFIIPSIRSTCNVILSCGGF